MATFSIILCSVIIPDHFKRNIFFIKPFNYEVQIIQAQKWRGMNQCCITHNSLTKKHFFCIFRHFASISLLQKHIIFSISLYEYLKSAKNKAVWQAQNFMFAATKREQKELLAESLANLSILCSKSVKKIEETAQLKDKKKEVTELKKNQMNCFWKSCP